MGVLNAQGDTILVVEAKVESNPAPNKSLDLPNIMFINTQSRSMFGDNLDTKIDLDKGDKLTQTQLILPQFIKLANPYEQADD